MNPRPQPFVPKLNQAEEGTLKGQLIKLGMYTIAASFEVEAERAAKDETPYAAYLARLIDLEMADKTDRSVNARIARARFPVMRTLEEFDFTFQPGLSAVRVRELANLAFLNQATNVLFIGGPGVGKTHLAISLGLKACAARRSVLFSSAADLLDELVAAEVSHNLGKVLANLRRVDLLIVDELGYLPMDGRRANLFFQLVAARYTRGSLLITSNVAFDGWGKLFGEPNRGECPGARPTRRCGHDHRPRPCAVRAAAQGGLPEVPRSARSCAGRTAERASASGSASCDLAGRP